MMTKPTLGYIQWTAFAVLLVAAAIGLATIPNDTQIPVHWGLTGEVDMELPAIAALLILPALALATLGLFFALPRFISETTLQRSAHLNRAGLTITLAMFTIIEILFVLSGHNYPIDAVRIIGGAVALALLVLGNMLPKSQPNAVAGIRLSWTLNNAKNWQATHRVGGALFLISGALLALAVLMLDGGPLLIAIMIGAILTPALLAGLYSYYFAQKSDAL